MIIDELITDRTAEDVQLFSSLETKPFSSFTTDEKFLWLFGEKVDLYCADGLLRASDKALQVGNMVRKGVYNIQDLNRVGQAITYIKEELHKSGYNMPNVNPKTDWVDTDIPTETLMQKYLEDIAICRSALPIPSDTPSVPGTMANLTYDKANEIEMILKAVYSMLDNIRKSSIIYCNDIFCGEV